MLLLHQFQKGIIMSNNLNLYYIFYEVAKTKNISKAAKELYISQPAISKAIGKLEQNLDCSLFSRNSRGVTLTKEGELLFEQIGVAFQAIKNGEDKIRLSNELGIGHLSIGVSTTLCKYVLLPYLKEYVNKNPHVKVSIYCQSSLETIEALEAGKIDIGLIGYPSSKNALSYKPIMNIHDTFVASANYLNNFALREMITKESLINNATFMMLNKENITRKYVDSSLALTNTELSNIIEVNNMDLLIDFAKTDLGISCVIKEFIKKELESGILKEIKLIGKIQTRQIGLAYLPGKITENTDAMSFLDGFN